ncbi:cytochrome P450 [Rhypophila decipiens]|uniref:Cytochrome P450 n=1 Tax=Rhypophila decipiens TaxID=261697 RepID=A0AAN7AZ48_9PEZI|nr:cytochrome P450 [Rhypophila decipiens]
MMTFSTFFLSSTATTYAVATVLSLSLGMFVYRLAFDPLKKFPGPVIARFTDGYAGYHAIRRRLHLQTSSDLKAYGPVYRQGPNRLVFNTVTALQDIYLNPKVTKARAYKYSSLEGQENLLSTLDRQRRRQKRKVYGRLLSERALQAFEPTMHAETRVFLRQLLAVAGTDVPVNMTPLCERLVTDVSGLMAFGHALETQSKDDNRFLPRAMMGRLALANMFVAWPTLSILGMNKLVVWWNKAKFDAFRALLMRIVSTRMSLPKDAKVDYYSVATTQAVKTNDKSAEQNQQPLSSPESMKELWGEATFLVPAGGMTTSGALTAVFFYLSRNPAAYARLASEIRTTFSSAKAIQNGPVLASCTYLRAVIDESLRLSVPTTSMPWRERIYGEEAANDPAASSEPFIVDGHVIPPGTMVVVNTYCIMHNEEYFPDPFAFRPERWLAEDGEDEKTFQLRRRAFVPFGTGEAMCLGKGMAYLETSLVVAKTLWYFDFYRAPGAAGDLGGGATVKTGKDPARGRVDEFQLYDGIVSDHDGPGLVFTRRSGDAGWDDLLDSQSCDAVLVS